jgi:hypothetical protein
VRSRVATSHVKVRTFGSRVATVDGEVGTFGSRVATSHVKVQTFGSRVATVDGEVGTFGSRVSSLRRWVGPRGESESVLMPAR